MLLLSLFVVRYLEPGSGSPELLDEWVRTVITDSPDFVDGGPWKQPHRWKTGAANWIPAHFTKSLESGDARRIAIAAMHFEGAGGGTTVLPLPVNQINKYLQLLRGVTLLGVGVEGATTYRKGAPFRRHYLIPRVARFIRSNRDELRAALPYLENTVNTVTLTERSRPVPLLLYRDPLLESQTESQAGPQTKRRLQGLLQDVTNTAHCHRRQIIL